MALVTEQEIDNLVAENQERYDEIYGTYDPMTGEGCYNFEHRVLIELSDFLRCGFRRRPPNLFCSEV